MKNICHVNINQKKAGLDIVFHKGNCGTKTIGRDRERHYIMTKGWIHQSDTAMLSVYA